ncbi:MAG: hypothetical protein ACJ8LG_22065 [Massilia sp.]
MRHRDAIVATIGFAFSAATLAALVHTDQYSRAASAEARGCQDLVRELAGVGPGASRFAATPGMAPVTHSAEARQ